MIREFYEISGFTEDLILSTILITKSGKRPLGFWKKKTHYELYSKDRAINTNTDQRNYLTLHLNRVMVCVFLTRTYAESAKKKSILDQTCKSANLL